MCEERPSRQTKHSDCLPSLKPPPHSTPSHSSITISYLNDCQADDPITPPARGKQRTESNPQSFLQSLWKGNLVSNSPSQLSRCTVSTSQLPLWHCAPQRSKNNCSLEKQESPDLFPLIPPFWIQISAAPVCSEAPLNFLRGAMPWCLSSLLRR